MTRDFLQPGLRYKPPYGALDLISLGMALIFGTAGLPHILDSFLHRARRANGANQRCLGDGDHRRFLCHDDISRLWRRHDRRARLHRRQRRQSI